MKKKLGKRLSLWLAVLLVGCTVLTSVSTVTVAADTIAAASWQKSGDRWWYRHADGGYTKNNWEKIGDKWYHFDKSGYMDAKKWIGDYYVNADGSMATSTWIGNYYVGADGKWDASKTKSTAKWLKENGKWWYRHANGSYTRNNWEKIDGKWYHFDKSGYMDVNKWIGNYYVNADGSMATNTWIGNYYVGADGKWDASKTKATDKWLKENGKWWYRHADGSYTKNDWEEIGGKRYYFDASGWMLIGWFQVGEQLFYTSEDGSAYTGILTYNGKEYVIQDGYATENTRAGDDSAPSGKGLKFSFICFTEYESNMEMYRNFVDTAKFCEGTVVEYNKAITSDEDMVAAIQFAIDQKVDAIGIIPNGSAEVNAAMEQAKKAGIRIVTETMSDMDLSYRDVNINMVNTDAIGQELADAVYDITGGSGEWAILSSVEFAKFQNIWIAELKRVMQADAKYAKLNLVEIAYGDDEPFKSAEETKRLLQEYPNLKVICCPTTVGMAACAKTVQELGSSVKVTGLGLPEEMKPYMGTGENDPCPYMFLWDMGEDGALGAYTAIALANGQINGVDGDSYHVLGWTFTVRSDALDQNYIPGVLKKYDKDNV